MDIESIRKNLIKDHEQFVRTRDEAIAALLKLEGAIELLNYLHPAIAKAPAEIQTALENATEVKTC